MVFSLQSKTVPNELYGKLRIFFGLFSLLKNVILYKSPPEAEVKLN